MSNNQEQQQFPLNDGMIESSASLTGLFEKLCYMYMSICIVCLQHLMGGTHKNSASSQRNDNKWFGYFYLQFNFEIFLFVDLFKTI